MSRGAFINSVSGGALKNLDFYINGLRIDKNEKFFIFSLFLYLWIFLRWFLFFVYQLIRLINVRFYGFHKNQRKIGLFICSIFMASIANASGGITPEEWPFLPTWCKYTQAGGGKASHSAEAKILMARIGEEGWIHSHHYCVGLAKIYRSHQIGLTEQQRNFWLSDAISELDYVLNNAPSNFILRPEILTKKGYALLRLKQYVEAEKNLYLAIKEQVDYWPPYGYLADIYLEQGQNNKAKEILKKGLKISPNAKGLKNRLAIIKSPK